jgi:hypothetical protein
MDTATSLALSRVGRGLTLVFVSLALLVLLTTGTALLSTLIHPFPPALVVTLACLALVPVGLGLLGQALCLFIPAEAEARRILLFAILVNAVAKALAIAEILRLTLNWWPGLARMPLVSVGILAQVLSVISSLVFLFFLKKLSRFLEYGEGEAEAEGFYLLWALSIFLYLIWLGVLETRTSFGLPQDWQELIQLMSREPPQRAPEDLDKETRRSVSFDSLSLLAGGYLVVLILVTVGAGAVGVYTFIRYCNYLTGLRDLIYRRIAESEEDPRKKKPGLAPS